MSTQSPSLDAVAQVVGAALGAHQSNPLARRVASAHEVRELLKGAFPGWSRAVAEASRAQRVDVVVRPLLIAGMLAEIDGRKAILLDSEVAPDERSVTLWHEVMHLAGVTDEDQAEKMARMLAKVIQLDVVAPPTTEPAAPSP